MSEKIAHISHLGQKSAYVEHYQPSLLEAVPRALGRDKTGVAKLSSLPFSGFDLWTAFELSWLNGKGKPQIAIAEFTIPADSPNLVESKSFKLYLNSFNQSRIPSTDELKTRLIDDLSRICGTAVAVKLFTDLQEYGTALPTLPGSTIDYLDISIDDYHFNPEHLLGAVREEDEIITETLSSNLLKSNCPVTHQPDWGSVLIAYQGKPIDQQKLLRYLISFRQCNEFHEHCVERIFIDLKKYCQPDRLTVFARYTRRGGLDINPLRSDFSLEIPVGRLIRQ